MNATFYKTAGEAELQDYLADGTDINALGDGGMAPVHWFAACTPHVDVMRAVLGAGGDVHLRSKSGFTPLHAAAAYNDNADVVRCLLENKSAVNSRNENGLTPLHGAAAFNTNPDVITVLVEGNARVDSSSSRSMTPLLAAAAFAGRGDIIKALVDGGADIREQNEDGETSLHLAAAFNRSLAITEALIDFGADVNAASRDGLTPLHYAALNHAEAGMVELLLARGADPALQDGNGKTARDVAGDRLRPLLKMRGTPPADVARPAGEWGTNQYFADATAADVREQLSSGEQAGGVEKAQGLSYLSRAARYAQDKEVLEVMIEHGADPNATDNNGNSALHWASKNKQIANEAIMVLLQHGADPSVRNKRGALPVEMAARNASDSAVIRTLLDSGPEITSGNEILTLFRAALTNVKSRKQHFQVLLDMGLDINTRDETGNTILHQNVRSKNWTLGATVPFLLENGADPELQNAEGQKPIDLATKRNGKALKDWQRAEGAAPADASATGSSKVAGDPEPLAATPAPTAGTDTTIGGAETGFGTDIDFANPGTVQHKIKPGMAKSWGSRKFFQNCSLEDVKWCLERDYDPNKSKNARTVPLLNAARYTDDHEIIGLLVKAGANLAVKDNFGLTPVHYATYNDKVPDTVIEYLVRKGADITAVTDQGLTPICTAARHATRAAAIEGLLRAGADINDRLPRDAESLLHIALNNKDCAPIITALLDAGLDINTTDDSGNTALHVAIRTKNWEIAALLIERGADPQIENNKHSKPLDLCIKSKRTTMEALITAQGGDAADGT